ncbi:hypothetical protein AAG906_015817 [Vitis piasezkii]
MRSAKVGAYCPSPAPTLVVLVVLLLGYGQISNMTTMLSAEFQKRSNFCVKDLDADWNQAFNLSFNLDFLASFIQKTKETKFYFSNFFVKSESSNYLRPNKNCNLTTWVSGCEPGWVCSVGQNQQVCIIAAQALTTLAIRTGEPFRLQIFEFLQALAQGGVKI